MPLPRGFFFAICRTCCRTCRTLAGLFAGLFRRKCLVPLDLPDLPDYFAQTLTVLRSASNTAIGRRAKKEVFPVF